MYKHDMNSDKRVKWTTYFAGAIEHVNKAGMTDFRTELAEKLACPDLLIYDPVAQEATKVGQEAGKQVEYIKNLKRAGHYGIFFDEMWRIWFGSISQNTDLIHLLTALRMRKHIEGNRPRDIQFWGDSEAVVRSDFIIVYLPKDIKTIGTIFEVVFAFLFRIPIYLILPDHPNTEANSSLLFGNMISNNGQLKSFYSISDCVKSIKEVYKI